MTLTPFLILLVNAINVCGDHQIGAHKYELGFEQCVQFVPAAQARLDAYFNPPPDPAQRQKDLAIIAAGIKALAADHH